MCSVRAEVDEGNQSNNCRTYSRMKPKLPPHKMPCEVEQPPTAFATNLGYSVRIQDGSVYRCDVHPPERIAFGEEGAAWLERHLRDTSKAYWLASLVRNWHIQASYRDNESAARQKYETQGKRKSA